jgi:hypothetical protein
MKIYRYWKIETSRIHIEGEEKEIKVYGGSNLSLEDASRNALAKIERIDRKIEGDQHVFDDYEVEIREEILEEVRSDAVITRNRYGASVLNVERMLIMDIDKPNFSLGDLFRKRDPQQDKTKIFEMVRKLASSSRYSALGFRIYETFQGARVIVLGRDFDARESETIRLMKEFNCDPLYTLLCEKQACYRARLTPKPRRLKLRGRKFVFPREGNDPETRQWLEDYAREGQRYSVCKFIEQVGAPHLSDDVVRLHDEMTGANVHLPLA